MKRLNKSDILQFIKFGIVGVSNTLVSFAVYYIFIWIDPKLYLIGSALGWVVSVANAFYWNNKYVFKGGRSDRRSLLKRLGKTYVSYGATFLLTMALLYLEVDRLHWPEALCPPLNLLITIPLNFLLNRFWAFQKQKGWNAD